MAYVYYFDHRTPQSPHGASHGSEIGYVFGNLGGFGGGPAGLSGPPRREDTATSELMMSYWVNFAKNGDPNGAGLPAWPAFRHSSQQVMYIDGKSGARPLPNRPQLDALDGYYAWRRQEAKRAHD
jgi:para-nitrobenzyl esterase